MPEIDVNALTEDQLVEATGGRYVGPCTVYTIQLGDTLAKIAAKYGTTVQILMEINLISDKNHIWPGHKLLIPIR